MQNFYLFKKEFFYRLDSFVLPATIINTMDFLIPEFGLLFWTLLAFLIVFFILKKFAWPAIVKGLTDRENSITESLATAEKVKNEMAQLKNDNEALLVRAREERAQLLKEAKEIKDKIVNDAKDEAKFQASKIIADAQATIHQQKMAALKNQIGNLVIETSEKVLRKELSNKAEHENYIKTLANEVKLN
jgi:F-type H+-transporting ATPase subunit b